MLNRNGKRTTPLAGESEGMMAISWAELDPEFPTPLSPEEFARLLDREDGWQRELINGRVVRMPANTGNSIHAGLLHSALNAYVVPRGLGHVSGEHGFFRFMVPGDPKEKQAAPDVSFVSLPRAPDRGTKAFYQIWRLVPDLAAEFASPDQDLEDKIALWLNAGVKLLWVFYPMERQVEVWRPGKDHPVEILGMADSLNGLEVVPGFRVAVREVL